MVFWLGGVAFVLFLLEDFGVVPECPLTDVLPFTPAALHAVCFAVQLVNPKP